MLRTFLALCAAIAVLANANAQSISVEYNATCYTAPNDSYAAMQAQFLQRNPGRSAEQFQQRLTEDAFDAMRRDINCRWIVYQHDGVYVGGFALIPRNVEGPLPVIIYNRAGQGPTGAVNFDQLVNELRPLAEAGFMVIGSQYRGGGGVFPQMPNGTDEYGGADVRDVLALPSVAAQLANIDEQRIGLLGRVRGSMMSFLAAKAEPSRFKAMVSAVTVSDLNAWVADWGAEHHPASRYIPNFATDGDAQMKARSAVQWADELPEDMPILLIHGGRDWEVGREQAEQLAAALEAAGRQHELTVYSHANHQLAPYQDDFLEDVLAFFRQHL